MHPWLLSILRDPSDGAPLSLSPDGQSLLGNGTSYPVGDGFPSFLPEPDPAPDPHTFNYAAHYTADAEVFDYYAKKRDALTVAHLRLLRTSLMRMVPSDARLILDVGCGNAFVAEHFTPRGVRVVSMDIAANNVRKALSTYPSDNHAAVVADAYRLPFADGTFDCIIASEIIEHTVDPQSFAASLLAKVKPGGTLLISTPYQERIVYSLCIHCNQKTPLNAHLHSFDKDNMRRLLAPLPADIVAMRLVGNKLLLRTHLIVPLSHLGHHITRLADGLFNRLVPKAEHFIIKLHKR
ncbi:MAG: class I SAM-dependent methyltransferase [Bacteroidales bacterium]|nr:class I SAM-dependent methyltransferase [Bacteroidales bacterium]